MSKPTDIRIRQVETSLEHIDYRTPIKFGGRVVKDVTLFNVHVEVETRDGRTGRGLGSTPVGNAWGWPSQQVEGEQTLEAMIELGERIAQLLATYQDQAHPLEIIHDLATDYQGIADQVTAAASIAETMPRLAQLVAASPTDAAVHDALGKALGENSYNLLGADFVNRDLGYYLGEDFSGSYLDEHTLRTPQPTMPLYHLVGALDPLTDGDLENRLDDGGPETLGEWICADGLTHLKIKLAGDDLGWDVARVVDIERAAAEAQQSRGCQQWNYSLDFNEKCADVQYVLDFLGQLNEQSALALSRVQYIEQPTNRDLRSNPENTMHEAAKIKPVVIDESLVDLESLMLSRELGYSGVALKACKGHGEALMMGAAARHFGLFLCVQDLTCVGASFLHSASIAARIPGIAAIEGNGRQYCPLGNKGWDQHYPEMFELTDGTVGTGILTGPGLGYSHSANIADERSDE
jgi:L-alanine-DL-glutamate epimerase-like enolase superfamily enzyme